MSFCQMVIVLIFLLSSYFYTLGLVRALDPFCLHLKFLFFPFSILVEVELHHVPSHFTLSSPSQLPYLEFLP